MTDDAPPNSEIDAGLAVETARWLVSLRCVDDLIETATSIREGAVGLHDGVLRLGNIMRALYALFAGLETSRDRGLSALADRLRSMAAHVATLGHGWVPVDDAMGTKLRRFPEFIQIDIERALASHKHNS